MRRLDAHEVGKKKEETELVKDKLCKDEYTEFG